MTLFFPDINVWLALSVSSHVHSRDAWTWLEALSPRARVILSRYTQLGLLRLLTNQAVMGEQVLTIRKAWIVYERWLKDPRIEFQAESGNFDTTFREAMAPLDSKPASKWVGDCYLLAHARENNAVLVTCDRALLEYADRHGYRAVAPA